MKRFKKKLKNLKNKKHWTMRPGVYITEYDYSHYKQKELPADDGIIYRVKSVRKVKI